MTGIESSGPEELVSAWKTRGADLREYLDRKEARGE